MFLLHSLILFSLKSARLNSTHYFIMKIPNKQGLQQIAFNQSSDIDFINVIKDLLKTLLIFTKKCTTKLCYFSHPSRFRKNLLERI